MCGAWASRCACDLAPGLSNALGFGLFFDLVLDKGAPRLHRLGRGGAVFFDVDDVEQVAGLAG